MKKFKIIFFTFLVFCISAFSCFPESYSKYIKEEEPIKFHVGFDKLYIGDLNLLYPGNNSTYKEAYYVVEFDRSQVMKEGDESQEVVVYVEQELCEIIDVRANAYTDMYDNIGVVIYEEPYDDHIVVSYKCNVSDITVNENGTDLLYTNVYIYEKFMPENNQYLYAKSEGVKIPLTKYYENYPKPVGEISDDYKELKLHIDTESKYAEFIAWIKLYSSSIEDNKYSTEIIKYINSIYNSEADILNLDKILNGLNVTYDSENSNYIFRIDDNFIGHARTYHFADGVDYLNSITFSKSNLSPEESNEILEYYLKSYSNYNNTQISNIMAYVKNYGSLNYIMTPKQDGTYNSILGFTYYSDGNYIKIANELLDYVDIFITKKITINFNGRPYMFDIFVNALFITYDFITDNLVNTIKNDYSIYTSIGLNNTSVSEKVVYSDYFTIQDTNTKKYILLNVYSDGIKYTCAEVVELGIANALSIIKNVDGYAVSMTVDYDSENISASKDNVVGIVGNIDEYFETSYKDKMVDDLFTTSTTIEDITSLIEENNITISYSMTN